MWVYIGKTSEPIVSWPWASPGRLMAASKGQVGGISLETSKIFYLDHPKFGTSIYILLRS